MARGLQACAFPSLDVYQVAMQPTEMPCLTAAECFLVRFIIMFFREIQFANVSRTGNFVVD